MSKRVKTQENEDTAPAVIDTKGDNNKDEEAKVLPTRRSTRARRTVDYAQVEDAAIREEARFKGVMLASKYQGDVDISGWLMSEKLDGVRCVWNGEYMVTRNGNGFFPPDWFIEGLPTDTTLDGELFLG